MKKIRVLIIEDSDVVRQFLEFVIGRDPRLEVVGAARSAEEGLRLLEHLSPDVISLDIRLPGMNGFEATRRIMTDNPTPIVVVSASVESEDLKITMNALAAGALVVVEKPVGARHEDYELLGGRLCTQLAIMSQVKVVRQRWSGAADGSPGQYQRHERAPRRRRMESDSPLRLMGIVCSTGGPNALAQLLGALSPDFPLPIVLVQHITAQFLGGFARWLETVCPFRAVVVNEREALAPGTIYLGAADRHLRANADCVWADGGDPVCSQRPSGTILFQSLAAHLGAQALGVILTGMGDDGAAGLLELRRAGGHTIAEDETTAVVYGMPAAAVRLDAVCESLPIHQIAARVQNLVGAKEVAGDG